MSKIGIITQARMKSTRLPGKILLRANSKTVLEHHTSRLKQSHLPVFIATTIDDMDDSVVNLSVALGIPYFRGDEQNVLERFYQCAEKNNLEIIIRVTSDCPLIDGNLIKEGVENYLKLNNPNVYYSNCLLRTYPRGLDFEIFSFELLKEAHLNATMESDREHVTPYIHQNKTGNVVIVDHTSDRDFSQLRWTLDTNDDWILLKRLFEEHKAETLSYTELLEVIANKPELATLNTHIKQKEI